MIKKTYRHKGKFEFEAGGYIDDLTVVYHISTEVVDPSKKTVWICHALTANSDPSDWWPELVGQGKFLDTEKYNIVCANMLGSAYGSSGPSSVKEGSFYFLDFPKITVRDIVNSEILLRKHLGIGKIDLLVGGSIGGFQALEWAITEPEIIKSASFIACGSRTTPWLTANNEAQRMAIEADSTFRKSENPEGGSAGLRAARAMALISYRSYQGYNATQFEKEEDTLFADRAASYERYQGKKLSDRFDAYSYWYLTYSVDSHNVGRGRGGVKAALSAIKADCAVIGIDSDSLFPVCEQKFIADNIPGAEYHEITSDFGHDGFLLEYRQIEKILEPLLEKH